MLAHVRRATGRPLRAGESLGFLLTVAASLAAVYVGWLQLHELPRHRIHVRWAPATSSLERLALEQRTGLHSGREREPRTWVYLLRDRSRGNIRRLVESPSVEDTAYIDRRGFHLQLDWRGRPDWLRQLAEAERLPPVGLALAALAMTGMWRSRSTIAAGARLIRWPGQAVLRPDQRAHFGLL